MTVNEPIAGVWTPWAQVLCVPCNNKSTHAVAKQVQPYARDEESGYGFCDECGCAIYLYSVDVAHLQAIKRHLAEIDDMPTCTLEQTGGMCVALRIVLDDEHWALVTVEEWETPNDLMLGFYTGPIDEPTEQSDAYHVAGVVELVERLREVKANA